MSKYISIIQKAIFSSLFAAVLILSPPAIADPNFEVTPVDRYNLPGKLIHNPMAIKWQPEGPNKRVSIVESEGVPGKQAISFQVKRKNISKPWDTRMRAPFGSDISTGEEIEIYVWLRAAKLSKGRDAGKIGIVLGRDKEPYDTIINQEVLPTPDWKMYKVSGVAKRDFPKSESEMGFNFGFTKQTIEIGPFFAVTQGSQEDS